MKAFMHLAKVGTASGTTDPITSDNWNRHYSRELIRHRLKALKADGSVECIGRGPGAKWRKRGNEP